MCIRDRYRQCHLYEARGRSIAFPAGYQGKFCGRVVLEETILAPGNGINRGPRSRKTERTCQRMAGGLRLVRTWSTCGKRGWSGNNQER